MPGAARRRPEGRRGSGPRPRGGRDLRLAPGGDRSAWGGRRAPTRSDIIPLSLMTISPIGRRMLRVEDRPLLTGEAEFVDDLELDGMLHARFPRSPVAHARLVAVARVGGRAMPGGVASSAPATHSLPPVRPPIENDDAW